MARNNPETESVGRSLLYQWNSFTSFQSNQHLTAVLRDKPPCHIEKESSAKVEIHPLVGSGPPSHAAHKIPSCPRHWVVWSIRTHGSPAFNKLRRLWGSGMLSVGELSKDRIPRCVKTMGG